MTPPPPIDVSVVAERLDVVRDRVAAAGGDPEHITIVAVTKGFGVDAVVAARRAGLDDIGENYAQELAAKADALAGAGPGPRWHFVGRLQRNKVRVLAPLVTLWQTVDRRPLVEEVARRAPGAAVLVQVNISREPQKGGCPPDEAPALVHDCRDAGLDVRGLMTVGPAGRPEEADVGFRTLADLADRLALPVRSMGMTDDLEVAVRAGSTMLRIGRALFGPRPA